MAVEKASPVKAQVEKAPEVPEPLVYLYLEHPNTLFQLGGVGLPDLTPEGTGYSPSDADIVRTMCMKYGIRYRESA
jgi:hypothetical protein